MPWSFMLQSSKDHARSDTIDFAMEFSLMGNRAAHLPLKPAAAVG
jgi:hypothetical protein